MRKFLVFAAFVFSMALGVAGVSQVSAAPNENANCVAQTFQPIAQEFGSEFGRLLISSTAQAAGGLGQFLGPGASSNCQG